MERFELESLLKEQQASGRLYLEFLRRDSMSMGLYVLPAGGVDPQKAHTEDEAYYIVSGQGQILVGVENEPVGPGSTVFVAAGVDHRFHSIEEDLRILVFFSPAEYSRSKIDRAYI